MADENLESAIDEAVADIAAEQKTAELESQLREANEKALRTQAELENYRKRMQRELADERRYAVVPLVRDLLAVVDNLERAIEAAQKSSEGTGLLEGVKMVATQLDTILKQHQCVRIETVGVPFDPHQHQAIAQEPSDQYPAGTVTRGVQSGYKLYDRVIRPAQVFVSTGAPAST
ncbi:MAG: nucleotide exchange factor GrpE [Pirellulaceae bacterium]|nr:nucleotide exchange factor GrpE [Pirellulaceae bacterium]